VLSGFIFQIDQSASSVLTGRSYILHTSSKCDPQSGKWLTFSIR